MHTSKKQKQIYILLLAVICLVAVVLFLRSDMSLSMLANRQKAPRDSEENMLYSQEYIIESNHVLERNGVVLRNTGEQIQAIDLASGIVLDVSNIQERSEAPIVSFSEYVGYVYMYDGQTLYRANLDGSNLRATIKDCLKYVPMGDYIYSIKMHNDEPWMFRCSRTGSDEQILFDESISDFWASHGNLLYTSGEGRYHWYRLTDRQTLEHVLPDDACEIRLDAVGMLYLTEIDGVTTLVRRNYNEQSDTPVTDSEVVCYQTGPHHIAALCEQADNRVIEVYATDGTLVETFQQLPVSTVEGLDVSAENLFVTDAAGEVWYTPLTAENWTKIF